jgi:hypothetical protein
VSAVIGQSEIEGEEMENVLQFQVNYNYIKWGLMSFHFEL